MITVPLRTISIIYTITAGLTVAAITEEYRERHPIKGKIVLLLLGITTLALSTDIATKTKICKTAGGSIFSPVYKVISDTSRNILISNTIRNIS